MTTLGDLRSQVYASIGGRDDADAEMWADRGINAGMLAFALLTEPPECKTSGYGNALNTGVALDLTTQLTRHIRLDRVYNVTQSVPVQEVPFRMWDLYPLPTSGYVRYFALHGNTLYYKPTPAGTEQLQFWYFQYPARLDDSSDSYPFTAGEDFVLAFAKRWAWACQEEQEDAQMWAGLASDLLLPDKTVADLRKYMREEWGYESNLPGTVSEGTVKS